MKKISLIAMSLALLGSNWSMAQAPRTPLIEEFTQASCPNCPRANVYLNPLLATYPLGQVVAIKYQVNYPGIDTLNLQNPADAGATNQGVPFGRALPYDILGVPAAAVDGDTSILATPSSNDYTGDPNLLTTAMISAEMALTTPITLTATFHYNSVTDSFTSRVVITNVSSSTLNASSTGNLKLFFSLEEMNIHFTPNDHPGDNGEGDFYYIDRKMYPSYNGTVMPNSILAGDSVVYTFTEKVPSYIYNKLQLGVAAFVQDMGLPRTSQSVLQAVFATSSNVTDAIMVDNTTYPSGTQVCNETYAPSLTLTNNGTTTLTSATVGYYFPTSSTPVTQNWTGSLAAGQSTTVTFPSGTIPDNTYGTATYFVNNLNGGTLIDVNDANNTPVSSFLISIPATATMDTLSEGFDESNDGLVGSVFTPISLNSTDNTNAFGFIADETFITNYVDGTTSSTSACGGYGASDASFVFCLACANSGQTDGLIFDKVNRAGYTNNIMTFQHAYAPIGSSNDVLSVLASTDCGTTWATLWTKSGSALATSPSVNIQTTGFFIPTPTQWVTDTVNVSSLNGHNDAIIQFQSTSNGGNAMYIDNINLAQGTPNGIDNISNATNVSLYPNPASNMINLSINAVNAGNCEISVINTLGQTVKDVFTGNLSSGNSNFDINLSGLTEGTYNILINKDSQTIVKRFTIMK